MNSENLKKAIHDVFPLIPDLSQAATDWVARAEKFQSEVDGWEQKTHAHVTSQLEEAVTLTKDSLHWGLEVSAAWRRQSLELLRRSEGLFGNAKA